MPVYAISRKKIHLHRYTRDNSIFQVDESDYWLRNLNQSDSLWKVLWNQWIVRLNNNRASFHVVYCVYTYSLQFTVYSLHTRNPAFLARNPAFFQNGQISKPSEKAGFLSPFWLLTQGIGSEFCEKPVELNRLWHWPIWGHKSQVVFHEGLQTQSFYIDKQANSW